MGWPLPQEYNEAIQNPQTTFSDPDLQKGEAVSNALGIPMPRSGNFADVYEVRCPGGDRWAVKCFTREVPRLSERYAAISRHLAQAQLPFIVDFTFLAQGIRVRGGWYPVLKMQWVEGLTLNDFVRQQADKPAMLKNLLQIWVRMAARLREAGIAHADLQHGNVILVPGSTANSLAVKLVDYDGMFVPALAGVGSGEVGHPCYQHPQRAAERTWSLEVDRFPLLLVATALDCLKVGGRALWEKYDSGDNLLFREADLHAPTKSPLFHELLKLTDERAPRLVRHTLDALTGRLEAVPLLEEVLPELHASPASRVTAARATSQKIVPGVLPAQPAAAGAAVRSGSPWDFRGEDKALSRRGRKGASQRRTWVIAGVGVAALVLVGGLFALAFRGESAKSKGPTAIVQTNRQQPPQHPATSREKPAVKENPPVQEEERSLFLAERNYLYKKHLNNFFAVDGTILGKKLVIAGKESPHGIFLHPGDRTFSEIAYKLGRNWSTFSCGVAVPRLGDPPEQRGLCLGGALSFEAAGDGAVLWTSDSIRDFARPQWCEVNVEKVDVLRLRVYCPGSAYCARAVWIEPQVTTGASRPRAFRIEGEAMRVLDRSGAFRVERQEMGRFANDKWSGDAQMWFPAMKAGQWADLELPVPSDGRYQILACMTRARDYGIVQFSLDGKPLGPLIDGFHFPEVINSGAIDLGTVDLNRGKATLRVTVVGTNEKSMATRYMWGLDLLVLQPVAHPDQPGAGQPPTGKPGD